MKMIYTATEQIWVDAEAAKFCKYNARIYKNPMDAFIRDRLPALNTQIKEQRHATAQGKTVEEMRRELARKNRRESLLIKKARLEKRLAEINAELEEED
jgi:hypothetical protein